MHGGRTTLIKIVSQEEADVPVLVPGLVSIMFSALAVGQIIVRSS